MSTRREVTSESVLETEFPNLLLPRLYKSDWCVSWSVLLIQTRVSDLQTEHILPLTRCRMVCCHLHPVVWRMRAHTWSREGGSDNFVNFPGQDWRHFGMVLFDDEDDRHRTLIWWWWRWWCWSWWCVECKFACLVSISRLRPRLSVSMSVREGRESRTLTG